jgi:choloylglycine hydrolase
MRESDRKAICVYSRAAAVFSLAAFVMGGWFTASYGCSTFYIAGDEQPVFGKNYDWSLDTGFLFVNKRGVSKVAMTSRSPAKWTSRYGSVTFNQYGRELPCGGMNEVGLVVELMWLEGTEYPSPDSRPALGNLQWIQYQLDNSATVDEVIGSDKAIRIASGGAAKIHYLVADRDGHCSTIEFIGGELAYHTNEALPWSVLTNDTYASSVDYVQQYEGFGGSRPVSPSGSSLGRFVNAASMIKSYKSGAETPGVDYAFDILAHVAQGDYTKWSIVYDINEATIHFRTFASKSRRYVRLRAFDFDCAVPVQMLDVNIECSGDVTGEFVKYSQTMNWRLIESAFRKTSFLKAVPSSTLRYLSRYPGETVCGGGAGSR